MLVVKCVLPGSCDANCDFCCWTKGNSNKKAFVDNFNELLDRLSQTHGTEYSVNITGGEPLLSPVFKEVLTSLKVRHAKGTLGTATINTNGSTLHRWIDQIGPEFRYVNISRHHHDDEVNRNIFKSTTVPSLNDLGHFFDLFAYQGVETGINLVRTKHTSVDTIIELRKFATNHNVGRVAVREEFKNGLHASNLEYTLLNNATKIHEFSCETCRYVILATEYGEVTLQYGEEEPNALLEQYDVAELIMHSDGKLSLDYNKERIIPMIDVEKYIVPSMYSHHWGGGCGGGQGSGPRIVRISHLMQ